jgi:hypothetical protein
MLKSITILVFVVGLVCGSTVLNQESLAVTIYNDNFAMVKDVR